LKSSYKQERCVQVMCMCVWVLYHTHQRGSYYRCKFVQWLYCIIEKAKCISSLKVIRQPPCAGCSKDTVVFRGLYLIIVVNMECEAD
jgi:hypothetical protein